MIGQTSGAVSIHVGPPWNKKAGVASGVGSGVVVVAVCRSGPQGSDGPHEKGDGGARLGNGGGGSEGLSSPPWIGMSEEDRTGSDAVDDGVVGDDEKRMKKEEEEDRESSGMWPNPRVDRGETQNRFGPCLSLTTFGFLLYASRRFFFLFLVLGADETKVVWMDEGDGLS